MNLPGLHFHELHGKPKRFAVAVNGPWRITFGFAQAKWCGNGPGLRMQQAFDLWRAERTLGTALAAIVSRKMW
ncbi:MAG: RelE-like toxin of type toxin-antitoxin system HigB [Pseudomonadota bacterium]